MIDNQVPKLNISNSEPKFKSIETTQMTLTNGFKTYDQAGCVYDEPGFTYDGVTGVYGNPPKF